MQKYASPAHARWLAAALFSLFASLNVHAAELDDVLASAQSQLANGQAEAALATLTAQELQFAGNSEFDYWLGLASVRAGKPAQGIFALERVLAEDPNHAGARLELASAYVQLGQREAASRELAQLELLDPPPAAAERIRELNKAVDRQEQAQERQTRIIYLTLEGGHDDNVGTWPDTRFDILPGSPTISPVDSAYQAIQGGIWQRFGLTSTQKLDVSLNGSTRANSQDDAEQFDQDYLSARAEWSRDLDGRHQLALGADLAGMNLDGEEYYRFYGVYGEWRNRLSNTRNYRTRLSVREVDFELDLYDYTQSQLLAGMTWIVGGNLRVNVDANVDYEAAANQRPGGDAVVAGLRAALMRPIGAYQRAGLTAAWHRAEYRKAYDPFTAFNASEEDRSDNRSSIALTWDWLPTPSVQLRARAEHRDQSSSLDTYEFDQTLGSLALSYYF